MATNRSAITAQSPPKLLILTFITLGLYWLVYINRINRQLKEYLDAEYNAGMRTFMFLIPFANIYAAWEMGQTAHEASEDINPGLAAVGFLLPIVGSFVVQPDINALASDE